MSRDEYFLRPWKSSQYFLCGSWWVSQVFGCFLRRKWEIKFLLNYLWQSFLKSSSGNFFRLSESRLNSKRCSGSRLWWKLFRKPTRTLESIYQRKRRKAGTEFLTRLSKQSLDFVRLDLVSVLFCVIITINHLRMYRKYFFWRARVCLPLLCLCRPFCIFLEIRFDTRELP